MINPFGSLTDTIVKKNESGAVISESSAFTNNLTYSALGVAGGWVAGRLLPGKSVIPTTVTAGLTKLGGTS